MRHQGALQTIVLLRCLAGAAWVVGWLRGAGSGGSSACVPLCWCLTLPHPSYVPPHHASAAAQVDKGVVDLPGTDGETETQGIDDLGKR